MLFDKRILSTLLCIVQLFVTCNAQKMLVSVPVADLRSGQQAVPAGLQAPAMSQDLKGQLSQLLFGEKLIGPEINNQNNNWVNVSALEQEVFYHNQWVGCSGYVQKNQVIPVDYFPKYTIVLQDLWTPIYQIKKNLAQPIISCAMGTMLEAKKIDDNWWQVYFCGQEYGFIPATAAIYELSDQVTETEQELRNTIVNLAKKFIGCSYVLGGRTPTKKPQDNLQITGIDCSDLINILFKSVGLQVPKNSTSQFYGVSKLITHGKDLLPGDLLFFTRSNDIKTMCHVMLYIGKDQDGHGEIIEATGMGVSSIQEAREKNIDTKKLAVRKIKLIDYLGADLDVDQIEAGKTIYKKRGYFVLMGSYFGSPDVIQNLRTKLMCY